MDGDGKRRIVEPAERSGGNPGGGGGRSGCAAGADRYPGPVRAWIPLAFAALLGASRANGAPSDPPAALTLRRTIPLPGVEGRIDHLAIDPDGKRLVVAALGNDSVEVIDLEQGKVARSLKGIPEAQGIAILPGSGQIVVTSGGDGTLRRFDGKTLDALPPLSVGADADNLRMEPGTARLFVGYGDGGLATVVEGKVVSRVPLSAHPESFQLEAGGPRVFVNVPGAGHVAVIDRVAAKVLSTWPVKDARANFPMAFDEPHQRLLVGCRAPARLLVLDTTPGPKDAGRVVASLEISGDVDDIFEDRARHRFLLSCGAGFVDVVAQHDADRYERVAQVPTAAGARTSLFVPATGTLYVAVPHRGEQGAEIREYAVAP